MAGAVAINRLEPKVRAVDVVEVPTPQAEFHFPLLVLLMCIAAGLLLRGVIVCRNASLWIDESMIALNIVNRTPTELLEPLDWNQGAPIGWLLLTKLSTSLFGPSELGLRFPSMVAGFLLLPFFALTAHRLLPTTSFRISLALLMLSPFLIGYMGECKQYEVDALGAVVLLFSARRLFVGTDRFSDRLFLALVGAASVWISHASVFVLGGIGGSLLWDALVERDRSRFLRTLGIISLWLVSFSVVYFAFTRRLGVNSYLLDYWSGKFLPFPPKCPGDLAWIVHHFIEVFKNPVGLNSELASGGFAALLFVMGTIQCYRANRRVALACLIPLVAAMAASGTKMYPFSGRLLLFAVPGLLLLVSVGALYFIQRTGRSMGVIGIGLLFASACAECRHLARGPLHAESVREAVRQLEQEATSEDSIYVTHGAVPSYLFYRSREIESLELGPEYQSDNKTYIVAFRRFPSHRRLFLLIAHTSVEEETVLRTLLARREAIQEWQYPGAKLLVFGPERP